MMIPSVVTEGMQKRSTDLLVAHTDGVLGLVEERLLMVTLASIER